MENPSKKPGRTARARANPALVYLADLAKKGRFAVHGSLDAIAQRLGYVDANTLPWHEMRAEHVAALRSWLSATLKPAVANRSLSALKGTLRVAWQLGQIGGETYARVLSVKAIRRSSGPLSRSLSTDDVRALVETCVDGTFEGRRDLAVIALGYCGGLRRSEIAALDAGDLKAAAEAFMIRVRGKGGHERLVFIDNGGAEAILDYLTQRGEAPGALFGAMGTRGAHEPQARVTANGLFRLFKDRARDAGLVDVSPHDLRRTYVSDALSASPDTWTISALSGAIERQPDGSLINHGAEVKGHAPAAAKFPYRSLEEGLRGTRQVPRAERNPT